MPFLALSVIDIGRVRSSCIASFPPFRFDNAQFAPELNGAVSDVRHRHMECCRNIAVASLLSHAFSFVPSAMRVASSPSFLPSFRRSIYLLHGTAAMLDNSSQCLHRLSARHHYLSSSIVVPGVISSFLAQSLMTASNIRSAYGCISPHRDFQVRPAASANTESALGC